MRPMTPKTARTCDALIASFIVQTARLNQEMAKMRPESAWAPWVLLGLAVAVGATLGLMAH